MPNVMAALPNRGGALCPTPQLGWRPILECRAVTLPRRETHSKFARVPQTRQQISAVGQSSPYYEDMWRRYCCLRRFFFPIVDTCLSCKDIAGLDKVLEWWRRLFGDFLRAVFSASRAQHVSEMHSKFTLKPHHVWKYGRHLRPLRLGEEKRKKEKRNHRMKIYMPCPIT